MKPIPVPDKLAAAVDALARQQRELQIALQATVEAGAAALNVPDGWQYSVEQRAYVPPAPAAQNVSESSGTE